MHVLWGVSLLSSPLSRWQGADGGREKKRKYRRWVEKETGVRKERGMGQIYAEEDPAWLQRGGFYHFIFFLIPCVPFPPSLSQPSWKIRNIIHAVESIRYCFPSPLTHNHPGVCQAVWVKIYICKRMVLILFTATLSALITTQTLLYY